MAGAAFWSFGTSQTGIPLLAGNATPNGKWEPRADPELATRYSTVA